MPLQAEPRQPDLNEPPALFGIPAPDQVRAVLDSGAAGVICGSAIVDLAASGGASLTPRLAKIVMFQRQSVGTTRGRND